MASETAGIEGWIYATLTGDATIHGIVADRVGPDPAEPGTACPHIVYTMMSYTAHDAIAGAKGVVEALYLIKGVAAGRDYSALTTLIERIDTLFHKTTGTSGTIACRSTRADEVKYGETTDAGAEYRHWGITFRIWAE